MSLYFHVPFCTKKCPYCHFYVLPNKDILKQKFLQALRLEWEHLAFYLQNKRVVSIYFGGGTPSLLKSQGINEILSWIPKNFLSPECEITLEANPENVTQELMKEMGSIGINRVSLGIQTLDNILLKRLGRTHTAQAAKDAVNTTYKAGIENISIDLMYDLPEQSIASWQTTLKQLCDLPITHLSLYNLTFEPHTVFYKKKTELAPLLPSPEESLQMLDAAVEFLPSIGLERYEISAFARSNKFSRHNTGYWTARPFLGLGPSAFSYWEQKRYRNAADLNVYAAALNEGSSPIDFEEKLPLEAHVNELLAVQLRLIEGVDLLAFESLHGTLPSLTQRLLQDAAKKGWIHLTPSHAKLTPSGLLFYDSVASMII